MVLDKLGNSLRDTLNKIANALFVDEKLINELIKDIQRSLLQADVNVQLVFDLSKKIKERALKEEAAKGLTKKEQLINIVYEELTAFLGGENTRIEISNKPFKIMLVGLFGNGKTTTTGKVAKFFQKRGNKVAVIQTDTWRPAAYEQLQQLAKQINVDFFGLKGEKNPITIYNSFKNELQKYDIVIVDTAGRDALSDDLITELEQLNKQVIPDETLLVMAADIGQAAQKQAEAFSKASKITGVIITKLDGTAKGGGALSACTATKAFVKLIGVGEKVDDLEEFKPKNFVGRLLGMGDLEALLEKAKEAISTEEAEDLGEKFMSGKFNLIDLYQQMEAMNKMGPLGKVLEMVPGFGQLKMPKDMIDVQQGKLKKWKFIIDSCTHAELEDPELLNASRVARIAKGSGTNEQEIRELVKQFRQSKKMMKMFKGTNPKNMEKMMGKLKGMPGIGM